VIDQLIVALRGLKERGKLDEAIAEFREAIRINPDFAEAHYNLGKAWHGLGELDLAVAEWREAIRLKPDYALAHYAIFKLSRTVRIHPTPPLSPANRSRVLASVADQAAKGRVRPGTLSARDTPSTAASSAFGTCPLIDSRARAAPMHFRRSGLTEGANLPGNADHTRWAGALLQPLHISHLFDSP